MKFKSMLVRVSGVRPDALWRTPHAGQGAATIGGALASQALLAAGTWGYAAHRLFHEDPFAPVAAVAAGVLGSAVVFSLDRAMTLSINGEKDIKRVVLRLAPRVVIAAGLAATMSIPATLRFARQILAVELLRQENTLTAEQLQINKSREGVDNRNQAVARASGDVKSVEEALAKGPDTSEYKRAHEAKTAAVRAHTTAVAVNNRRLAAAYKELRVIEANDAKAPDPHRVAELKARIRNANAAIADAAEARAAAEKVEEQAWSEWHEALNAKRDRLVKVEERYQAQAEDAESRTKVRDLESERQSREMYAQSLAREYLVFQQIVRDSKHPESHSLRQAAMTLHFFFFLLEMFPILLKISLPIGPLETAAEALDREDNERINVTSQCQIAADRELLYAELEIKMHAVRGWKASYLRRALRKLDAKKLRDERNRFAA